MTEERRDLQTLVSDMRVDLAAIKTRTELQTGMLARLEQKLDLGVFREEYERRHRELELRVTQAESEAQKIHDDFEQRQGRNSIIRWAYGAAITLIGLAEVLHH